MLKIFLIIFLLIQAIIANDKIDNKKIKALMPANFYPYFSIDKDGKPSGYAVEVFKEIAKRANIDYEIVVKPTYVDVENAYLAKEGDLIIAGGISEKRKKISNYTQAVDTSIIRAYKLKSNPIKELKIVDDKKLTLKMNNVSVKIFKEYPQSLIRMVNSKEEGLLTLLTKESDVFVFNENALNSMLKQSGFDKLVVPFGEPVKKVDFAIRVQKEKVELVQKLDDALNEFKKTDRFKDLYAEFILGEKVDKTNEITFSNDEIEYLKNNTFTICDRVDIYPLSGTINNSLVGISGEVLEKIKKVININYNIFLPSNHEALDSKIKQNECDILSFTLQNQDKFQGFISTNSYYFDNYISLSSVKNSFIDSYTNLKNLVFYVKLHEDKQNLLNLYPDLNVIVEHDVKKIMKIIKDENNKHFIGLKIPMERLIQKYGFSNYKITGVLSKINPSAGFGVNEDNKTLLQILNKALLLIPQEELEQTVEKFRLKEFVIENKNYEQLKSLFIVVFIITLFIIIGLLYIRNKISSQNKRLEALLDLSTEGIFIFDFNANLLNYSKEGQKNLGFSDEEMENLKVFDFDKALSEKELLSIQDLLNQEKKVSFTRTHTRKDGSTYIAQVNARIIDINKERFIYTTVKDITEQLAFQDLIQKEKEKAKKSEEEALKLKENAEKEKENALYAMQQAKISEEEAIAAQKEMAIIQEDLIKANMAKSEFLANMSHEIRTPLSGIIGLTDIMLDDECTQKQKENLTIIKNSSNTLRNVINDILDFSKLQAGKFQIIQRHFSLRELVNDLESLFKPQIEQKKLKFIIKIGDDVHDYLIGDSLRIHQIFNNLIGNSIKFTQKGEIEIDVETLYQNNDVVKLKFCVKDTGIGIKDNVKSQIFESFAQGEVSYTKNYQGTGLGLAITKSLVELMNGKIWFDSTYNVGTSFCFTLSLKKLEFLETKKREKINSENMFKGKKALVVEDSEVNQLVINEILTKMGFEVHLANDGKQSVKLVKKEKYDIVFMDIQMPDMDGYEATRLIREIYKDLPIIAVSAAVQDSDKRKSIEAGMNKHLKKPIDKNELVYAILKYLDPSKEKIINKAEESKDNNVKVDNRFSFFDYSGLCEDYGEDFVLQLLMKFYEQYKDINEVVSSLDNDKLDKYIHKLKGSSGSLKMNEIYDLCIKIREKNLDKQLIQELVSKLNSYFSEIKKDYHY